MCRKLYLAPFSGHNTTNRLLKEALSLSADPSEILYIAPSPRKLRDTQLAFAQLVSSKAFIPPRFYTIGPLARELHAQYGDSRPFPSELKPLLIHQLLNTPSSLGYARAVGDFISDIKRYVSPDECPGLGNKFRKWLAGYNKPLDRALQALDIMARYDALLAEKGWADNEDILHQAAGFCTEHIRAKVLILDGFVAPNLLEQKLLANLVKLAEMTLALTWGTKDRTRAYEFPCRFTDFITGLGGFKLEYLKAMPEQKPVVQACTTIDEEVAAIARDIKQRFLSKELNLTKTVITFPKLARYAPLVRRIFKRYRLPFTIYPSQNLSTSPPIVAVLELLGALETGYERLATAAFLSSPFFPKLLRLSTDKDDTSRNRAATRINLASKRAGIIKGRNQWRNIGARLIAAGQGRLDETQKARASDLQKRVRQAIGLTESILSEQALLAEQAKALKKFLEVVEFRKTETEDENTETDLREDKKALYDIIDGLVELDNDWGPVKLTGTEFIRTLTYLIGMSTRKPEPRPAGVTVISMEETLSLSPRHLYFSGLTEEDLPSAYPADPILPDYIRRNLGMPDIEFHHDQEQFHFHRTIASAQNEPFLSYHNSDGENLVLPTPFLEIPPEPARLTDAIYSEEELQHFQGESRNLPLKEPEPVDFSDNPELLKVLGTRFGPETSISVTRLENYRRCPFRFYLEHVMKLESLPEPAYEIDAAQWGLLVHRVLEGLYSEGPIPLQQLPERARTALNQALAQAGLPVFWEQVTRRVFDNILPDFIRVEQQLRDQGYLPQKTEARIQGEPLKGLKIHGRLDRVDASKDAFRIIDYKTGSTAGFTGKAVVIDHTHMQLPLYARLLQERNPNRTIDNIGIWSIRDAELIWLGYGKYPVGQLIDAALENAREVAAAIRSGRFPTDDVNYQVCRNCELKYLCGRKEKSNG